MEGNVERHLVGVSEGERITGLARATLYKLARHGELRSYVATGEPLDKAGAYALQGDGRRFVTRVIGSETNVIGLPLEETLALLQECGAPGPEAEAERR